MQNLAIHANGVPNGIDEMQRRVGAGLFSYLPRLATKKVVIRCFSNDGIRSLRGVEHVPLKHGRVLNKGDACEIKVTRTFNPPPERPFARSWAGSPMPRKGAESRMVS
jgi:hypothetical protein